MHQIDGKPAKFGYVGLFHHIGLAKSLAIGLFIVFITPFIYTHSAHATQTVPYKMNFQGRLTDSTGSIKPDGLYNVRLRLMSAATSGTNLWQADRIYTNTGTAHDYRVQVTNGLFSIQLGDSALGDPTLSPSLFNTQTYANLYLEIELPTPATATCNTNGCQTWTEGAMTPRSPLAASGYALNADAVDGIDGSQLVRNDTDNTLAGTTTHNGVAVFNGVNYFNNASSFSADTVYSSYAYANFNQAYNGTGYIVQNTGTSAQLLNEPDTGFQLKVSSYKTAGTDTTSDNLTVLTGIAANNNLAGLIDSGVTYGANLLSNPGFEFGCAGWTGSCATATVSPNSGLANLTASTAAPPPALNLDIASRTVAVKPGDQLYASVRIKSSNTNAGGGGMYMEYLDASGAHISYDNADWTNPGTSYITKSWVFTVPANAAYAELDLTARGDGTSAATWSFDDAVLKAVYSVGPAVFRSEVNSSTAFQVQDTGGNAILGVDTNANRVLAYANNGTTVSTIGVTQAGGGDASLSVSNATNNYNLGLDATDNKFKLGTYAGTSVAGIKTYSNNMDSGNANTILTELVQATSTGSVPKVSLHFGPDATGTAQAAIYSDNGSRTAPLTKLASSGSVTPTANQWVDFTLSGVSVTAGQYYWVAYNVSSATAQQNFAYQTDGVTQKVYVPQTYGTWPGSWPGGSTNEPGLGFGMTMTITSATQTDQFATTALSVNQYGQTVFQAPANSTQAFQIQNTNGTQLFNADTVQNRVTITKVDTDTLPTLNLYQGSSGDSALSVSTSTQGYNVGLDGTDGAFKIGTYGNSTSGVTTPSGNLDSGNSDFLICSAIQAKTTGYVSTLRIHLGAISGHMKMAIYDDNGTRDHPVNVLGSSASISLTTANAWQSFPLGSTVNVYAGTTYWLCFNSDSNTTEEDFSNFGNGTVAGAYKPTTYSTAFGSSPMTGGSLNVDTGWAVNMDVALATPSDQFAVSPFKMNIDGSTTFKNTADSNNALVVQSAEGQSLLSLDTANMGVTINGQSGVLNNVTQRSNLLTVDSSASPIFRDNVNGIQIKYEGGNISGYEAAGMRIDYAPGNGDTNAGTWDGLRIVANATGATASTISYGLKLEGPTTPGAGQDTAQYIGTGWDLGIDIQSGGLQLGGATTSDPTSVAANNLQIYAKNIAGRTMPTYRGNTTAGSTNASTPLQASLGFNRITMMTPGYNTAATCPATAFVAVGPAPLVTGTTCQSAAPASTNMLTASRRTLLTTASSSNAIAFVYPGAQPYLWRGNAAGLGGFFYTVRFGTSTTVSGNYAFVGLAGKNDAPISTTDPTSDSTYGKLGVGINASTGNWKFINNITSSAPTAPDLGSNFPVSTSNLYELVLYCAPNGSSIGYKFTNLSTGNSASSSVNSNIPSNTTFMQPYAWIGNHSTASAATIDIGGWYTESDY